MKICGALLVCIILTGCSRDPQMNAWEHLQHALDQDEASVLEYIAYEHLSEIIAFDNVEALREAAHYNPDDAVDWIVQNYRNRVLTLVMDELPEEFIPVFINQYGDRVLDQIYRRNPSLVTQIAVRNDPYLAFDQSFQRDPYGIIRRAIDQDPRYAAQYIRDYYSTDLP